MSEEKTYNIELQQTKTIKICVSAHSEEEAKEKAKQAMYGIMIDCLTVSEETGDIEVTEIDESH